MTATYTDRLRGVATSVAIKAPVAAATTANITLSGLQTVDGVVLAAEDRVLVKEQTDATENGIWVTASGAWERARDFNGARDVVQGTTVFVPQGTANAGRTYYLTTEDPVIGTSELTFTQVRTPLDSFDFESVAVLLADESLAYSSAGVEVADGDVLRARAESATYEVAASAAADHHLTTAGGVKLYVLPGPDGALSARAFGAVADGATDATAALGLMIAAVAARATAGLHAVGAFDGDFLIASTLTLSGTGTRWLFKGTLNADAAFTLNSPMLTLSGSQMELFDPVLDCTKRAAGILDSGGLNRIHGPTVTHFQYRGIDLSGSSGGGKVFDPLITQWQSSDAEFASDANFTGVGIYFNRADIEVGGGITRWCGTCVQFSANAQTAWLTHHHPYNGRSGGPARVDPKLIVVELGAGSVHIRDCYLDNGQIDLYSDNVSLRGCSYLCGSDNVSYSDSRMIGVFANGNTQPYRLEIDTGTLVSLPSGYAFLEYLPHPTLGHVWSGDYSGLPADVTTTTVRATVGEAVVYHASGSADYDRLAVKPQGTLLYQHQVGTASPVEESYNASDKTTKADTYRVQTKTGTEARLYLGANSTGLVEDGSNNLTVRVNGTDRIAVMSTGVLRPVADNTTNLGAVANRWATIYAGTGTINTSDANEKQDIRALSAAELAVAQRLTALGRIYRFKDAVAEKGDAARLHAGVMAQDVAAAFAAEGLDAANYGLWCADVLDDGTTRLGVRYDELCVFILAALTAPAP